SFENDMRLALQPYNQTLSQLQVLRHDSPEHFVTGNESGVQGRFVANVCNPVVEVLKNIPGYINFRFGDLQAAEDTRRLCHAVSPPASQGAASAQGQSQTGMPSAQGQSQAGQGTPLAQGQSQAGQSTASGQGQSQKIPDLMLLELVVNNGQAHGQGR